MKLMSIHKHYHSAFDPPANQANSEFQVTNPLDQAIPK